MALDRSLKSRRFEFLDQPISSSAVVIGSWKKSSRRSKRRWQIKLGDDELSAARLVMLARTGGGPYPSRPANPAVPKTTIPAAASLDYSDVKISQESVPTTPSPRPPLPKSYRSCVDCGKGFNSYQALGGHKASCRLKPTTATANIDINPYAVIPAVAIDRNPYVVIPAVAAASTRCTSAMNRIGKLHECETCHKSFTSGQALGGHKRRHYEGVIGGGSKKSRKTSSNGGAVSQKMIRDFDLNLPPPPDQDLE